MFRLVFRTSNFWYVLFLQMCIRDRFMSCAAVSAVFPGLTAQLAFASFVFTVVWYFFICRILFNIIGSYKEVTGTGL